jgi:hypothetical protein
MPVDPRCPLVGTHPVVCLDQVLAAQQLLQKHRRLRSGCLLHRCGRLALLPVSREVPPLPFRESSDISVLLSASLASIKVSVPYRSFMFGPSLLCTEAIIPSADFCPSIFPSHDGSSNRHTDRSPRVLRTDFIPPYPSHLHPPFRMAIGLQVFMHRCLLCASCSSGREYAYTFLQTPPRGGSPWYSAHGSRYQGP